MTSGDAWFLWGERVDLYDDSAWKSSGAPATSDSDSDSANTDSSSNPTVVATKTRTTPLHPFAASIEDLRERLGSSLQNAEVPSKQPLHLLLPHRGDGESRQPVPGLAVATKLALAVPNAEDLSLVETEVPCLQIDAATAVDFFTRIVEQPIDEVLPGHDIRFWSEVSISRSSCWPISDSCPR